jgi:hypothetical protein
LKCLELQKYQSHETVPIKKTCTVPRYKSDERGNYLETHKEPYAENVLYVHMYVEEKNRAYLSLFDAMIPMFARRD